MPPAGFLLFCAQGPRSLPELVSRFVAALSCEKLGPSPAHLRRHLSPKEKVLCSHSTFLGREGSRRRRALIPECRRPEKGDLWRAVPGKQNTRPGAVTHWRTRAASGRPPKSHSARLRARSAVTEQRSKPALTWIPRHVTSRPLTMQVNVQRLSPVLVEFDVEIAVDRVKSEVEKAYISVAKTARVSGFRQGGRRARCSRTCTGLASPLTSRNGWSMRAIRKRSASRSCSR